MGARITVPVTPAVLAWAIDESGIAPEELAAALDVSVEDLDAWRTGATRPGITQLRQLATRLHRQLAVFLLPRPPAMDLPDVQFRNRIRGTSRTLTPVERRILRRAGRLQRALGWLHEELALEVPDFPEALMSEPVEVVAGRAREALRVTLEAQQGTPWAGVAFDLWRDAVESRAGVYVFLFSLERESCRAFTLWDARAPVIVINTAWSEEARTFSLLHELGHVMTRTSSACGGAPAPADRMRSMWDPTERWCEQFAAAVLLPAAAVRDTLGAHVGAVTDLAVVRRLARRFRVSLSAAVLRLIELRLAGWPLWDALPDTVDDKPSGGGGGKGRNRTEIREDQIGRRATRTFRDAVAADVLSETQALSYLDAPGDIGLGRADA